MGVDSHRGLDAAASPFVTGLRSMVAAQGHFDELRGPASPDGSAQLPMAPHWASFFDHLEAADAPALNAKVARLNRQLRDNGVTYNVYADADGPPRPWSLDLFPLIVTPHSWNQIEAGVLQRVRLLEKVLADVYGPQSLLQRGLIPPALVQGHPGYLRAMQGTEPVGGTRLQIAAFDLAHGPDGSWSLVSQRTQAPSGLGYLLENRLAISRLFPQAFEQLRTQGLAGAYQALVNNLKAASPGGRDAHIALLTPGPYSETYFEHAYLARYLGLTLVQGGDMVVRDERLFLKTLRGLVPIHGLLNRLDDAFLDPLELRSDSSLGVPGLLQAVRAGHVLMANLPGSALLESPALLGFLPALARDLLGEELALPTLSTWWCGERTAMDAGLPQLAACAVKPTYPAGGAGLSFQSVLGRDLSDRERSAWAVRIAVQGDAHTLQAYMPLSQLPTWQSGATADTGQAVPRSVLLRVFAVCNGVQSWQVLPGGLARVAHARAEIAAMQRGGSSADVWVTTDAEIDHTTLLTPALTVATVAQRKRLVTSRAAENLYWLGRYTERTENAIALARLTLECLRGEDHGDARLIDWLDHMARLHALVPEDVCALAQSQPVFEQSLIDSLGGDSLASSVGFNLRAVRMAAAAVRERLSYEHWHLIERAHDELASGLSDGALPQGSLDAIDLLKKVGRHMAAITGAQTDRMTRDDGWRLLSIGRHVERLDFLASSLRAGLMAGSLDHDAGFEAMLALFDSTISFRSQFQQNREMLALIDLLVLNRDNPRSLAWVAQTLRGRLAKLAGSEPQVLSSMSLLVPDPALWDLALLGTSAPAATSPHAPVSWPHLQKVLSDSMRAAHAVSDSVGAAYFSHSGGAEQSVGV